MTMINPEDQLRLLQLARRALESRVRREAAPVADRGGVLEVSRAAFVTLLRAGELRGCLGRLGTHRCLGETIVELAASVSDSDPRFEPVRPDELPDIQIEISVLTPEWEIASIDEIEVGRHGLIVEQGHCRGLLLPQVATEHRWDRETFLSQTCLKATLPRDAWKSGARILAFEAQVFGERELAISDS